MKFAGKSGKLTEGVTLSGVSQEIRTVNG